MHGYKIIVNTLHLFSSSLIVKYIFFMYILKIRLIIICISATFQLILREGSFLWANDDIVSETLD